MTDDPNPSLRLLLIDPDENSQARTIALLSDAFINAETITTDSLRNALSLLESQSIDFIISDLCADEAGDTLATIKQLQDAAPETPILIHSETDNSQLALRAIQVGAMDYLVKGRGTALTFRRIIQHSLERKRMLDELAAAKNALEQTVQDRTRELATALSMLHDASRAKEQFFTNMTHELRTPLHAIINFSRFGIKKIRTAPPEKLEEYFTDIHTSGQRLLGLVNDLLDLTKLTSGHADHTIKAAAFAPLLEQVAREMKPLLDAKQIALALPQEDAGDLTLLMDSRRIHQVLVNLIGNACKFSPPQSIITVTAERQNTSDTSTPAAIISVIDEGEGIPDNELQSVFDEFAQSSKVKSGEFHIGTGLGLAICQQIICAHGGTIWAEHNPKGGAIVRFMLPIAK